MLFHTVAVQSGMPRQLSHGLSGHVIPTGNLGGGGHVIEAEFTERECMRTVRALLSKSKLEVGSRALCPPALFLLQRRD